MNGPIGHWPDALYPTGHGQLGKDGQMPHMARQRGNWSLDDSQSVEETPAVRVRGSKSAVAPCSEAHGAVSG
eukprot:CAMPEP_0205961318 /NCGR_PEP_ID=MMETSP1459-20131121/66252_1 /ASSEMBLY_ACC=CAM_ASM_001120 /TAXON_ID=41880 /ORGANISM="Pycnococcus provasolii, Strain RCC931" /LENGTH=71 /DNA_ID=CAMNT_0053334015 /DNA_START=126 /DNA_END=341 /DNA_ORIENTATION=+